jgi:hypothetical protein
MDAQIIALIIIVPFILVFLYAGFHEYRRYTAQGRATYGLVYNEETGTTHVGGISEDEESYDPESYDPNSYQVGESQQDEDEDEEKSG